LIVPSTIVMPRDGSFALAFLGIDRRVHDQIFSVALGGNNLALKRIVDLVSCSLASFISGGIYNETQNLHSLARPRLVRRHGLAVRVDCSEAQHSRNSREVPNGRLASTSAYFKIAAVSFASSVSSNLKSESEIRTRSRS
jgi:hypothetical protein